MTAPELLTTFPDPLPAYLAWSTHSPRKLMQLRRVVVELTHAIDNGAPLQVYAQTRCEGFWYKAFFFAPRGVLKVDTTGEIVTTRQHAQAIIRVLRLNAVSLDALMANWDRYGIWPRHRAICL